MLAITYKKITKIKVAEWGTPKKYLKKKYESANTFGLGEPIKDIEKKPIFQLLNVT
jgi:hypothetical protein